jgi:tRNA A-37 threonylcarbamoyl transferase component Bud32
MIEEYKREIKMYKRKKDKHGYSLIIKKLEDQLMEYNKILYNQMNPSKRTDPENLLLKEIMIQKKAGDLGIAPKVITWNRDGNSFIMEYIDGMTLSDYLESNDLDSMDKLEFKDSLRKLISTLHHNNIYHNDLNQDNILITRDHRIYIIDYGLSTEYPIDVEDNVCSEDDENLSDFVDLKYINELIDGDESIDD